MVWKPDNQSAIESIKVVWDVVPYTAGRGLELGCGTHKLYPHFIGVDSNIDETLFGPGRSARGADIIAPCEKLAMFADDHFDFVFSSHLLEHIKDYKAALAEWWRVIKPGGNLVLYLPHKAFYPNIGQPFANPDHKHDFVPQDIIDAMVEVAKTFEIVRSEDRNDDDEYSFFQVFRKPGGIRRRDRAPEPGEKRCAVIRYGAYGDVLQASSALPALKAEGYHITFYTVERGYEVLQNDPHIDRFVIQDNNQVPQAALGSFFEWMRESFDKCVNFCNIVEGHLLPDHNNAHFFWPKSARHLVCNGNYVETMHRVAEIPYDVPRTKFYPSEKERAWAIEQREKLAGPVVVWSLSGSSPHKVWPYVDNVVARIMLEHPTATVVFVGGPDERWLTEEWKDERRVRRKVGEWTIRDALAFSQVADLVVGPETGVLNAVAMDECWKILFLSHSTFENLPRDWVNTHAFAAVEVECYPCHRLHREGWKHCNRHPEGGAACQVAITPDDVWPAFDMVLKAATRKEAA